MSGENSGFWEDVQTLFADAIELDASARASFLNERCRERPALRAEVESLIAANERSDRFLDVAASGGAVDDAEALRDERGRTIGQFRLLEKIGEGGMGAVYRAEREDGEFTQRVAVKLIDLPVRNRDALRRFRAERQILATLNHPHIVTLLDGGLVDGRQAYLVMEYVDGVPITAYCSERRLALDDRLRLFRDVCGAVQDAHQHGVVHRDLKPANILVTADGVPKILDFGVAKLIDTSGREAEGTVTGVLQPLTPNYASPEQVRGLPATTVSDVYGLGVLLYELLTGARPYETTGKTVDEILRIVGEEEPARPSACVDSRAPLSNDAHRLRGDLDAIALKAMAKDPAQRYAPARELAEDLSRHLAGRPVVAREPSFRYVAAKLARRHRAAFASAAVALVALVAALGFSLWQMRIAVAERDRATARFNDTRQLANALIFKIHDAVRPLAGSTPVRQSIVAEALKYLERLSQDPAGDDGLRLELAQAYHRIGSVQGLPSAPNLGDREGALKSFTKALDLLRPMTLRPTVPREAALEFGQAALSFAVTADISGARAQALAATREAASIADVLARRDPSDTEAPRLEGSALFQLALLTNDPDSLPIWQRAGEVFRELLAQMPNDPNRQRNVALVEKYLGAYYDRRLDHTQALVHHIRAQELDEQRVRADPTNRTARLDLAIDLSNVANTHWGSGRLVDAAAGFERSLEMRQSLAESDPKDQYARSRVAFAHSRLGRVYAELGRHAEALRHVEAAVRISEAQAGIDNNHHELFADAVELLGDVQQRAGRLAAACQSFRRARAILTDLASKGVDESSPLMERMRNDTRRLEPKLSACAALTNPVRSPPPISPAR